MQSGPRAVLFANGQSSWLSSLALRDDDYLVAVDGGLSNLQILGLKPALLIGDLDSISAEQADACANAGTEILQYPPAKDETDLELALNLVIQRGYRTILLVAALGDRIDHTLGSLGLLCAPKYANLELYADDGRTRLSCLHGPGQTVLDTQPGDTISLIPWQGIAVGITTKGLQYPLQDESLYPWQTRGVSNLAAGTHADLSLKSGSLLLIHIRQINEEKRL